MLGTFALTGFIPTTDAARARQFYVEKLGLEFVEEDEYSVALRSGPNIVRLVKVEKHKPTSFTILGWETDDVEKTVRAMISAGIKIERFEFIEHDDLGIWTSPDGTSKIVWFLDPDGNFLSVAQHT